MKERGEKEGRKTWGESHQDKARGGGGKGGPAGSLRAKSSQAGRGVRTGLPWLQQLGGVGLARTRHLGVCWPAQYWTSAPLPSPGLGDLVAVGSQGNRAARGRGQGAQVLDPAWGFLALPPEPFGRGHLRWNQVSA